MQAEQKYLSVIAEAGRDAKSHQLVRVSCSRCGQESIMRMANVKRNKSCGCLKRDKWHKHIIDRQAKKPIPQLPESIWTQFDDSMEGPLTICAKVSAMGLYVPQWKPKSQRTPVDSTKVDSSKKDNS